MPLEIKELHIKVEVKPPEQHQTSRIGSSLPIQNNTGSTIDRQEIIESCIEQILDILKEKMEA